MIAVADASPVCYLILIGEIDLLSRLFGGVLLPREAGGDSAIERLSKTSFRCSPLLFRSTLERFRR